MQVTRDVCDKRYMEGIRGVHVSEIGRFKSKNSFVKSWILNPPLPTVLSSLLSCKEVTSMRDSIRSNKSGVHMPNSYLEIGECCRDL
jgi:hypothetical protein